MRSARKQNSSLQGAFDNFSHIRIHPRSPKQQCEMAEPFHINSLDTEKAWKLGLHFENSP